MILFIIQIQKKAVWIENVQQFLTIYATSVWNMKFMLNKMLLKLRNIQLTY